MEEKELEDKYLLIKKNKWYYLVGGFLAVLVAIGVVGVKSVEIALQDEHVVIAKNKIVQYEVEAQNNTEKISNALAKVRKQKALSGWHLVYENNAKGKKVFGDLASLKDHIRSGADIKVYLNTQKQEYTFECEWAFIDEYNDVSCMNTSHISMYAGDKGNFGFRDPAYHWFLMVNTKGKKNMSRYNINGSKKTQNEIKIAVKWFVNQY